MERGDTGTIIAFDPHAIDAQTARVAPCIGRTVAAVRKLGPHWQESLAMARPVVLASPIDGAVCASSRHVTLSLRLLLIPFDRVAPPFALVAADPGTGPAIVAAFLPDPGVLLTWMPGPGGMQEADLAACALAWRDRRPDAEPNDAGIVVHAGHPDLTGYIAQSLAGLQRMEDGAALRGVQAVAASFEPLGPVERIIPALAGRSKHTIGAQADRAALAALNPVLVGDRRITPALRARLQHHLEATVRAANPMQVDAFLGSPHPRVVFGVRIMGAPVAQAEALIIATCASLRRGFGAVTAIIDGFCLPADIDRNPNYPPIVRAAGVQSMRVSESLHAAVAAVGVSDVFMTAFDYLPMALWMAMHADLYVTERGTQQGKAGWLSDSFGVVHAHPDLAERAEQDSSLAASVPGATVPAMLPRRFVAAAEGARHAIVDAASAADWILARYVAHRRASLAVPLRRNLFPEAKAAELWQQADGVEALVLRYNGLYPGVSVNVVALTRAGGAPLSPVLRCVIPAERLAGETCVVSVWLWLPAGFAARAISLAFGGTASPLAVPAALALRETWQRIWTATAVPEHEAVLDLSLCVAGQQAGSVLYAHAWQVEPGAVPTPYAAP